jgi:NAD(P)-dependent dehydrogenase (short-subunit alcohol dehydrogenase family)
MSKNIPQIDDLSGRVAFITGGAGFLGEMHAEAIAEAGGIPILADINGCRARKISKAISTKYAVKSAGISVDITKKADVELAVKEIVRDFGCIDILINNAANNPKVGDGKLAWGRFENYSLENWNTDIEVGLTGAFICTQIIGSAMAQRGKGVIVNISSDLGIIAPDQSIYRIEGLDESDQPTKPISYSVVKTALIGFTRYVATYWARKGVRANALCPGGVQVNQSEDFLEKISSKIPLGRMARRNEYKSAIRFLASDASSYMTGSVLVIDGGRTCW